MVIFEFLSLGFMLIGISIGLMYLSILLYWIFLCSSIPQEDCRGIRKAGWFKTMTRGPLVMRCCDMLRSTLNGSLMFWRDKIIAAWVNPPSPRLLKGKVASATMYLCLGFLSVLLASFIKAGEMSIPKYSTSFGRAFARTPFPQAISSILYIVCCILGFRSSRRRTPGITTCWW